jgi:hypothetical protein
MDVDRRDKRTRLLARTAGIVGLATAVWVGVMGVVAGNPNLTKVQLASDRSAVDELRTQLHRLDNARDALHLDFVLLSLYGATFVLLALLVTRRGGRLYRAAGIAAIVGAVATCVCDAIENVRTLRLLDAETVTQSAIDSLRSVSYAKWTFSALTVLLLTLAFTGRHRTRLVKALAAGTAVAAAVGLAGVLARSRATITASFALTGLVELVASVLLAFWPERFLRGFSRPRPPS